MATNTQNDLGIAWYFLPTGDRSENLKNAITAYEQALTVFTKDGFPFDWAIAIYQKHIGEKIGNSTWEATVNGYFAAFESQGLPSGQFQHIREILNQK